MYLGMGLLGWVVTLWGAFSETAELSRRSCGLRLLSILVTILKAVKLCLIVVLICIFLMINEDEYLFMCLLTICISSLEECLKYLLPVLKACCLFVLLYILWTLDPYQTYDQQMFSVILWGVFADLLFISEDHSAALLVLTCSSLCW